MHVAEECSPGGGGGGGGGGGCYLSFECGLFNRRANHMSAFVFLICCFYSVRGCTISANAEIITMGLGLLLNSLHRICMHEWIFFCSF